MCSNFAILHPCFVFSRIKFKNLFAPFSQPALFFKKYLVKIYFCQLAAHRLKE